MTRWCGSGGAGGRGGVDCGGDEEIGVSADCTPFALRSCSTFQQNNHIASSYSVEEPMLKQTPEIANMSNVVWFELGHYNPLTVQAVPQLSGVYVLYTQLSTLAGSSVFPFYVGRSETDVRERLLFHLSAVEPNLCIKQKLTQPWCQFVWGFATARDARGIEKYLFDIRPPYCCNDLDPGGVPIVPDVMPVGWPVPIVPTTPYSGLIDSLLGTPRTNI